MILVISGTNRPDSKTKVIAEYLFAYLKKTVSSEVSFISLDDVSSDFFHSQMYETGKQPESLVDIQDSLIIPSEKWIIVSPEYNGSFPGVLKTFIDALSMRKYAESFASKKVALVGVSSGRAGNLRGMEHLTGLLNYLKMHVHPEKLPVSKVEELIDEENKIELLTRNELERLVSEFLN